MEEPVDESLRDVDADVAKFLECYGGSIPASVLVGLPPVGEGGGPLQSWAGMRLIANRYRMNEEIGRGAQGVVYRGWDVALDRQVALKILHPFLGQSAGVHRLRFEREAKTASRLEHEALCPVLDFGEEDSFPFIVMKFVDGANLSQLIAEADCEAVQLGSLSAAPEERLEQIARFFESLAEGLQLAHEKGVFHRDVKPGNIIVAEGGRPVLLDFGCARDDGHEQRISMTNDILGTIDYMAPERLSPGTEGSDPRADVYSIGITLFECVTGRRAFGSHSREATLRAVVEMGLRPVKQIAPRIPEDLATIVATAAARDPARRYSSAAALAEDLRRFREHRPILARPIRWPLRTWMWMGRNPVVASLLAVCTLALALVTFFWLEAATQRGRADEADGNLIAIGLKANAQQLWPMRPEQVPAMQEWLQAAQPFSEELADLCREVRGRADYALSVEKRSLGERATEWAQAIAEVAATVPELKPQMGLVPLGADPQSGMQEFLHLDSHRGALPTRDAEGTLQFTEDTGLILVLIPGGSTFTGMQSLDPSQNLSYVGSSDKIDDVRRHTIEPYFISKYEVSLGQWMRIMGTDPNRYPLGSIAPEIAMRGIHPVEMITWEEAAEFVTRLQMRLPSEIEWEHAARGGGPTIWWRGLNPVEVGRRINVADATAFDEQAKWTPKRPEHKDGYLVHAPVNTLEPNDYGLYHIVGNVWEWCQDWSLDLKKGPISASNREEAQHLRALRGASFENPLQFSAIAHREQHALQYRNHSIGIRPALSLAGRD